MPNGCCAPLSFDSRRTGSARPSPVHPSRLLIPSTAFSYTLQINKARHADAMTLQLDAIAGRHTCDTVQQTHKTAAIGHCRKFLMTNRGLPSCFLSIPITI